MIDRKEINKKAIMEKFDLTSKEFEIQRWFYENINKCIEVIKKEINKSYIKRVDESERFRVVRGQIDMMKDFVELSWAQRGYITEGNVKFFGGLNND